jgi:SAM-dependent methyltransferase
MTGQALDAPRVEAFAGRVVDIMNSATLSLMMSVAHRTGLFDELAAMPPATSAEIAADAGLDERYVREWLKAMTVGRIVEHDPATDTYWLPPEHAASLTRAAGPANLANLTQYVSLLGNVEDDIVECFRNGGGVPYARFPRFQALMAEESAQVHDAALLDGTLRLVDGLTERLDDGIDVLDVGCGQGHALLLMAQRFPASRFTGWDFSEEGIGVATADAASRGLTNVTFAVKDAATIDGSVPFDLVCVFDAIHDQAQPARVLQGIADSLRPGGVFLCVDIGGSSHVHENLDHPLAPMLYSVSTFHCMTVSLALDGAGLGTMWGEQLADEMLREAGFTSIETKRIPEDIVNVYYVARRD